MLSLSRMKTAIRTIIIIFKELPKFFCCPHSICVGVSYLLSTSLRLSLLAKGQKKKRFSKIV